MPVERSKWPPELELLLAQFRVPDAGNVYSLGCLETRRVTLGSQQVRAVNLIHALAQEHLRDWREHNRPVQGQAWPGYRGWHPRILIVGGSAGGLTAAGFAAYRGAQVVLIEAEAELMAHLMDCDRLLHPRLYEWGSVQPFLADDSDAYWSGSRVGLPLLDWVQARADAVRKTLLDEWMRWSRFYEFPFLQAGRSLSQWEQEVGAHTIRVHANSKLKATTSPAEGDQVLFNLPTGGAGSFVVEGGLKRAGAVEGCSDRPFDIIILAVGFGREKSLADLDATHPSHRWIAETDEGQYWQFRQNEGPLPERVLIAGSGDGALTDLFRMAIRNFRQDDLPEHVRRWDPAPQRSLERVVISIESEWERAGRSEEATKRLARAYLAMPAPRLDDWVRANLRNEARIELAVRPVDPNLEIAAFASPAFPLNRLLLASLIRVSATMHSPIFRVVPSEGQLPLNPAREAEIHTAEVENRKRRARNEPELPHQKWHLVYRAGVSEKPIMSLFGPDFPGLKALIGQHAKYDITRQPIWPFHGESGDNYRRPENIAFIMAAPKFDDRRNAELFRNVRDFHLIADVFDSIFQAALYQATDPQSEVPSKFYLGIMRLFAMMYNKIYVLDTQFYDGAFFQDIASVLKSMEAFERDLICEKFVVRRRKAINTENPYAAFMLTDGKLKPFKFSSLSKDINHKYAEFVGKHCNRNFENLERVLEAMDGDLKSAMTRWISTCQELSDELGKPGFLSVEPWPDQGLTRFWDDKIQLENPSRLLTNFPDIEASAIEIWHRYKRGANRTQYHEIIDENIMRNPERTLSFEHLRDWFDRAYNRMVTLNQGANVFGTVYSGDLASDELDERDSVDLGQADISICQLGELSSEGFEKLYSESEKEREKLEHDRNKPIDRTPWALAFDAIQKVIGEAKLRGDLLASLGQSDCHAVQKLRKYASIQNYRIGWVGDIDVPGGGIGTSITTESRRGTNRGGTTALPRDPYTR